MSRSVFADASASQCHLRRWLTTLCLSRVGAETLLKVYGVKVDPEEFAAFAGMGEVSARLLRDLLICKLNGTVAFNVQRQLSLPQLIFIDWVFKRKAETACSAGILPERRSWQVWPED